jgi:hypothetical protein
MQSPRTTLIRTPPDFTPCRPVITAALNVICRNGRTSIDDAEAYAALAADMLTGGAYEVAEFFANAALQADPDNSTTRTVLALAMAGQDRLVEAIRFALAHSKAPTQLADAAEGSQGPDVHQHD